jgi:arabinofuranosyltransferase
LCGPPWLVLVLAPKAQTSLKERVKPWLVAGLPLASWELFSLVYFGSLVPNTSVAKLNTGLPRFTLIERGFNYFLQPTWNDPLSLLLLLVGLPWGLARGRAPTRGFCVGAVLYLSYIVCIGGDFMAGRFLAGPVLIAVLTLLELAPLPTLAVQGGLVALVLALSFVPAGSNWSAPRPSPGVWQAFFDTCLRGVCDERALYGPYSNWRNPGVGGVQPADPLALKGALWSQHPELPRVSGSIGYTGFFAGPAVFIVDYYGLSDPLVARLSYDPSLKAWTPGHFKRCVPLGYPEATQVGPRALLDPALREYYSKIWIVTRGPLWSLERWRAIWQLNTSAWRFDTKYTCRSSTLSDNPSSRSRSALDAEGCDARDVLRDHQPNKQRGMP